MPLRLVKVLRLKSKQFDADRWAAEEREDARGILALHPGSLERSRQKFFWFLCGWLGGPQHYMEQIGHPRLRMRHMPYAIGDAERDAWMACMDQALVEQVHDAELRTGLRAAFARMADHLRNTGSQVRPGEAPR